jgi:hypothetical protein
MVVLGGRLRIVNCGQKSQIALPKKPSHGRQTDDKFFLVNGRENLI